MICPVQDLRVPTPFDCVWSRRHNAFGKAGGTPVSPHGLGYPTPFDHAGTLLRVLLLVSTYSTTCSRGLPACGVVLTGDPRLAVDLRFSRWRLVVTLSDLCFWRDTIQRRPSTTGSADRCRRPSLGYPMPFDRAGTPLGVLL
jgi:hypothetical protein